MQGPTFQKREFQDVGRLEDVKHELARASRHPVHIDLGREYSEAGTEPLGQGRLQDEDPADALGDVVPVQDKHVVWNNRDDERAYFGSQRYNLIQHREVIDAVQQAVGETTGSIEKGVIRDYGAHVNGVLVFGDQERGTIDVRELVGDGYMPPEGSSRVRDRLGLGMRFHNSFNGRSGYGGSTMAYRFICQNWMVWGEETIARESSLHIKGGDEAPGVDPDYFVDLIQTVFEQRDPLEGVVKRNIEEGEIPLEWAPGVLRQAGFGGNYRKRITSVLLEQEPPREGHTTTWNLWNAATTHLDNEAAKGLGPERYDHHQECAWRILDEEPERPDEEVEDLTGFATSPATA